MRGKHLREMGSEELDFSRVALVPGSRGCRIFADRGEGCSWFSPRFEWFPDGVIFPFKIGEVGCEGSVTQVAEGGL
jgi:hypothetical protein